MSEMTNLATKAARHNENPGAVAADEGERAGRPRRRGGPPDPGRFPAGLKRQVNGGKAWPGRLPGPPPGLNGE
jgi:hypothetical protein